MLNRMSKVCVEYRKWVVIGCCGVWSKCGLQCAEKGAAILLGLNGVLIVAWVTRGVLHYLAAVGMNVIMEWRMGSCLDV